MRFVPAALRTVTAAVLAAAAVPASALGAQRPAPVSVVATTAVAVADARADSARRPYVDADVAFMTGMIHHHAQAVLMAGWAPTHGASDAVQTLCARIVNAQRDEIHWMQQWLIDRRQGVPVPVFTDTSMRIAMGKPGATSTDGVGARANGADHAKGMSAMHMPGVPMSATGGDAQMLMPGMLTQPQLDTLRTAHGHDFDLLFLRYMIQHHTGAISMVRDLFASQGAAQDEVVFKLASAINVDQATEIARMHKVLVAVTLGIQPPE